MNGNPGEQVEKRFEGIAVSPGVATGLVVILQREAEEIPQRQIRPEEVSDEIARFEAALIATRAELLEMQQKIAQAIGASDASIFDAHLLVVEDRTLIDEVLRGVASDHFNVEYSFHRVAERYCRSLGAIDDPYLRERVIDIEDVSQRIIRHLLGKGGQRLNVSKDPHVIVAHNLTPSDTALIDRNAVLGFATEAGSKTSHTAILARSMDIPAVVGLHEICSELDTNDTVLIDGYRGLVIVNPAESTLAEYDQLQIERDRVDERLEAIRDTISTTSDGRHIVLSANIELADEMEDVREAGAEGIGLYRTEFLFINSETPPDEETQYKTYRDIAERCQPHSVIIRTLDIGGDKDFDHLGLLKEDNPFLGCRAIRFCLSHPDIFKPQLRAILRATPYGDVKIMYPMVSDLAELMQANAILEQCKNELREEGIAFDEDVQVGAMIEVPSAALTADLIAGHVAFFSIGTNDLIQYTIAVDRGNDRIAHLYQPTHPSILRLVRMTVDAARSKGIWVGVCGEMAGEVTLTPILLGLGIEELSTSPSVVPRVKKAVQSLDIPTCESLVKKALQMTDPREIFELSVALARERYGDLL